MAEAPACTEPSSPPCVRAACPLLSLALLDQSTAHAKALLTHRQRLDAAHFFLAHTAASPPGRRTRPASFCHGEVLGMTRIERDAGIARSLRTPRAPAI